MSKKTFFIMACALLLLPLLVLGQTTVNISGVVMDEAENPLQGANILVKNSNAGAAADINGQFSFSYRADGPFVLVVRFMGYKTREVSLNMSDNLSNLSFALLEDVFLGEAVVVTGIASKRAKSVAEVAVARVPAAELTTANSYSDVSDMLAGKVSGVNIQRSSGNVGSGMRFNVRSGGGLNGDEQPIIIVDGIRVENEEIGGFWAGGQGVSSLNDLNPEDIESIEFLKGPAGAASYGTNGSNGVVLITTKRGKLAATGGKGIFIDYKMVSGYNDPYLYSKDHVLTHEYVNENLSKGPVTQHTLNASGGTNLLKYFVGIDRRKETGVLPNNVMDRKTFRANLDIFPTERLVLNISSSYSVSDNIKPPNDDDLHGYFSNTLLTPFPNMYPRCDRESIMGIQNKLKSNRFYGSIQAQYTPFENFHSKFSIGVDYSDYLFDNIFPVGVQYREYGLDGSRQLRTRTNTPVTTQFDVSYDYSPFSDLKTTSGIGVQLLGCGHLYKPFHLVYRSVFSDGDDAERLCQFHWDGSAQHILSKHQHGCTRGQMEFFTICDQSLETQGCIR